MFVGVCEEGGTAHLLTKFGFFNRSLHNNMAKESTNTQKLATIIQYTARQRPNITQGKLTPEIILRWKLACELYFKLAGIRSNLQIASVALGFRHSALSAWYLGSHHRLDAVSFQDFVQEMQKLFIAQPRWPFMYWFDNSKHCQKGQPFMDWVNGLLSENASFEGTSMHITNFKMYNIINSSMDRTLREHLHFISSNPHFPSIIPNGAGGNDKDPDISDTDLWKWIMAVKKEYDDLQAHSDDSDSELSELSGDPDSDSESTSNITSRPTPSQYFQHLPPLTQEERNILRKSHGCTKCRRRNVYHNFKECPNGFPSVIGYKGII